MASKPGAATFVSNDRHWHWHWHWPGTGPALARHAGLWLSAVLPHSLQRQPARMNLPRNRSRRISGWWGAARKINYTGDWLMGLSWCLFAGNDSLIPYFYRYLPYPWVRAMDALCPFGPLTACMLLLCAPADPRNRWLGQHLLFHPALPSCVARPRLLQRQVRRRLGAVHEGSPGRLCPWHFLTGAAACRRCPSVCRIAAQCIADRCDRSTDRGPHGPHVPSDGDAEKGGSSIHRLCRSEEDGTDMPQASSGAHELL